MIILNQNLDKPGLEDARYFNGSISKIMLSAGTALFKFTEHTLFGPGRDGVCRTTPWWALRDPRADLNDGGYSAVIATASASGKPLEEYLRSAFAVMLKFNAMSSSQLGMLRVQHARLLKPVYCFHGLTSAVPDDRPSAKQPPFSPVRSLGATPEVRKNEAVFGGGAMQILIPNITGAELMGSGITLLN